MPRASLLRQWLLISAVLVGMALLGARERSLLPGIDLRAVFLPVPGGSATLLLTPESHVILIGGGKDLTVFEEVGTILPFRKRTIDLLVLPDARDVSLVTLAELAERFAVRQALLPAEIPETLATHRSLLDDHRIPLREAAWDEPVRIAEGITLTMAFRGKSKHALTTITAGTRTIALPGTAKDLGDTLRDSILRAVVWDGDEIMRVVTYDTKEEGATDGFPIHNLARGGRLILPLPEKT